MREASRIHYHLTVTATETQYLHQDHLGSTGLVTTASGAFARARFHAPFGAPWYTPTTAAAAPALGTRFGEPWPAAGTAQPVPPVTDRHYTGQRSFEASLGSLYHYQARWYSPVLGRFLSPDPLVPEPGNPQALNRYSYVYNNPFGYTDPTGLASVRVRTSAGEVWRGVWGANRHGARIFIGRVKLYGPAQLERVGSSRWRGCHGELCTLYQQHYVYGHWVLTTVPDDAVTERGPAAPQAEPDCEDPGSPAWCVLLRPGPGGDPLRRAD